MEKRLAIVASHPIQYYAPVFALLSKKCSVKVFYTWGESSLNKYDPGFGKKIEWDIPLLVGYEYEFLENSAKDPGTHHFLGIINPDAIKRIQAYNPDALLIYGWSYLSHLRLMKHFKNRIPVLFRGDSHMIDSVPGIKNVLRNIFLKWIYNSVSTAFYVGSNNKSYYLRMGLKEKQLLFAPHAVDNSRFSTDRTLEAVSLRNSFGLSEQHILILFAGKFSKMKNPHFLLEAFQQIKNPLVHLLFVGNGELEDLLKEKASCNNKVHFLDFQNQSTLPVCYHSCDLFCLPSQGPGETWGLAINEAMSAGKAVLVSDKVGCSADLVKPGLNGYIFKSNNKENLVSYLDELTQSKSVLEEMGKESKKIIESWSFEKQVAGFLKVFCDARAAN